MSKSQVCARFVTLWNSGPSREIVDIYLGPKLVHLSLIVSSLMRPVSLVRAFRKEERTGIIPRF